MVIIKKSGLFYYKRATKMTTKREKTEATRDEALEPFVSSGFDSSAIKLFSIKIELN